MVPAPNMTPSRTANWYVSVLEGLLEVIMVVVGRDDDFLSTHILTRTGPTLPTRETKIIIKMEAICISMSYSPCSTFRQGSFREKGEIKEEECLIMRFGGQSYRGGRLVIAISILPSSLVIVISILPSS